LSQCQSQGPVVRLGEVAKIFAADRREADSLGAIELVPAPSPGQQRFLRLREIQDILILRGANLAAHSFSGSNQVMVSAAAPAEPAGERPVPISTAKKAGLRVRKALVQYLEQHVSATEPWSVEVELNQAQARLVSDAGCRISINGGRPPWVGSQRFEVSVTSPNGPLRFLLDAHVELPPRVVVATRSLPRGAVVQTADIQLQYGKPIGNQAESFHSLEEVLGQQTVRAISAGKVLEQKSLRPPLLVRRGRPVTVYARSPGVKITTTARARDDGSLGDLVAVESMLNRRRYFARVCGIDEVEVYARSKRAGGATSAGRR